MESFDHITLLVQLVAGALGGNIAGGLFKNLSLGALGNTIGGLIGGAAGGKLLTTLLTLPAAVPLDGSAVDPMAVLSQAASGAGGGLVAVILIGILRGLFGR